MRAANEKDNVKEVEWHSSNLNDDGDNKCPPPSHA
jgi:hypothetical protein